MGLAVWLLITQGRVRTANKGGNITAVLPCARTDGIALPTFDGQIASLKIKEQGLFSGKRPKQRCFANAAFTEDASFNALGLFQTFIG